MSSKSRRGAANKKKKKAAKEMKENVSFDEELEPVEVQMVPTDQLQLNEAELNEEFTKSLISIDPNKPGRNTKFNFKDGTFESAPNDEHLAIHFSFEGLIWHKKEEEIENQKKEKEMEEEQNNNNNNNNNKEENNDNEENEQNEDNENQENKDNENENENDNDENNENKTEEQQNENENENENEEENKDNVSEKKKKQEKLAKNQFNFSERASQTFNQPLRDREIMTEPAPKSVFSQNANSYIIRDEYLNNLLKLKEQQRKEEAKKKKSSTSIYQQHRKTHEPKIKHTDETDALLHSKAMLSALKIMERVTVLNANSDSYDQFRYYKTSDFKARPFLTHLWIFKYSGLKQPKMVTSLCWNPKHNDLFAVGFGSYDFHHQTSGLICIYSLKSTAHPEKIIPVESGVMCMDFHPKYASLLCIAAYDGSVCVYDIRNVDDTPIYSSENPESHHNDPVWGIKWYYSELVHELSFYTISSDGLLKNWKMSQNELLHTTTMELKNPLPKKKILGKNQNNNNINDEKKEEKKEQLSNSNNNNFNIDDITSLSLASCSCFDFNPSMEHLFLVGTETGKLFQCSRTYTDGLIASYEGHDMNIYAVKWNPFHSKTFLSCSEDWLIKLWDADEEKPIISYDLNTPVSDIAWAPYSATVFAAVTMDGKVHIFDLSQNKNAPLCTERVTKKCGLTHVAFPANFPVIIVGDERGIVYCLKLSPSLFKIHVTNNDVTKLEPTKEKERLEKVLKVTGSKVLDLELHLSPMKSPAKKSQKLKSPLRSPFRSPLKVTSNQKE